jgi:hypothetical protein
MSSDDNQHRKDVGWISVQVGWLGKNGIIRKMEDAWYSSPVVVQHAGSGSWLVLILDGWSHYPTGSARFFYPTIYSLPSSLSIHTHHRVHLPICVHAFHLHSTGCKQQWC